MGGLRSGILLFCIAAVPLCASAQPTTYADKLPPTRTLARFGLERAWWNQATLNVARERVRHLVADEEVVIVQSSGGIVTCFDAENGKRNWSMQIGRRDNPSYPATMNQGLVLITSSRYLYAINKLSGNLEWQVTIPSQPSASPGADDRNVYVGCLDGSVYAFSLRAIRELYAERRLPEASHRTIVWTYKTGAAVTTPPLPIEGDNVVCFASLDHSLYCVTKADREVRFQFETDAPVAAPLAYHEGRIYLASQDYDLYCINVLNGNTHWRFVSGTPIVKKPYILGDDLFLLPETGGLFCLSVSNGTQRWWRPDITQFLTASPTRLYVSDSQSNIVLLSRQDGALLGAFPLRPFPIRVFNDRTDRLFLASDSGLAVGLHEIGQEFPIYHLFPERRPILPEFAPENPEPPADDV